MVRPESRQRLLKLQFLVDEERRLQFHLMQSDPLNIFLGNLCDCINLSTVLHTTVCVVKLSAYMQCTVQYADLPEMSRYPFTAW